ncbi:uncharacterized protein G2W53_024257 [Senna tora]|uniref:Uncharacterized protein n=1 Tax=Senna tora TaxID=362788 RepID=A0A834TBA0_9FABA|nr:uncharacterized protein G2W53_024257 [Senna tora]
MAQRCGLPSWLLRRAGSRIDRQSISVTTPYFSLWSSGRCLEVHEALIAAAASAPQSLIPLDLHPCTMHNHDFNS